MIMPLMLCCYTFVFRHSYPDQLDSQDLCEVHKMYCMQGRPSPLSNDAYCIFPYFRKIYTFPLYFPKMYPFWLNLCFLFLPIFTSCFTLTGCPWL